MSKGEGESVTGGGSAQLTVRLGAVAANYREVKRRAANAAVAPVVKADGYHVGMLPVARTLAAEGADSFFVARAEEGIELRRLLPTVRIFIFDGAAPSSAEALIAHRLIPVLNSPDDIAAWSRAARGDKGELEAALHVDTGMNRLGLSKSDVADLAGNTRRALSGIRISLIMSHLACADEPDRAENRRQLDRFRAALAALPSAPASLAASAGIELGREYLFDMVRPGLAIYGGNPIASRENPYRTVGVLSSRVLQIRKLDPGETVGYAATFSARRPTILAIVAHGYADGLIRASSGKGRAAIGGVLVPYAGRISMDLLALDVTDLPENLRRRGAEVEFIGDTVSLQDMADAAGTIAHEVLTSISSRARRVYLGG